MFKSKVKGLYVDISEFSILAARTSGYADPITVEEIAELRLGEHVTSEEIRDFLEQVVDFKGSSYYISRCGFYPEGRFVRYYQAESTNKARDPKHLASVLENEFSINSETNAIYILDAKNGSDFDMEKGLSKQLIFAGAPIESVKAAQQDIVGMGLYPDRLELSSLATIGAVADYMQFASIKAPVVLIEINSTTSNIYVIRAGKLEVSRPVSFGLDSIFPLLQRELGLKDEISARKLFFSNTFDFAEMGPKLLRRVVKEVQAIAGLYEVQTGLTIEIAHVSLLPDNLEWITNTITSALSLEVLKPDYEAWLNSLSVKLADGLEVLNLSSRWLAVFSLMVDFQMREKVLSEQE